MEKVLIILPVIIAIVFLLIPENKVKEENQYEFLHKGNSVKKRRDFSEQTEKLWRLIARIARRFERIKLPVSEKKYEKITKNITYAGMQGFLFPEDISTVRVLTLILVFLYFAILYAASGDPINFLLGIPACILGFFLPETLLRISAERRQNEIGREFPGMITSLAIITDAGLNLIPAIETLVNQQREHSFFADELNRALEEIKIGIPQKEVFVMLSARTNVEEVRFFVSALIQGLEKGSSGMTDIIRTQANESWQKRKLRAKELADKASIKLFLPLLLLVFPAFAIFLMGPMIFQLIELFSIF